MKETPFARVIRDITVAHHLNSRAVPGEVADFRNAVRLLRAAGGDEGRDVFGSAIWVKKVGAAMDAEHLRCDKANAKRASHD